MIVASIMIIVLSVPITVFASKDKLEVSLNNVYIEYDDNYGKPYIDENNRTMVPLRLTLERFGAKVDWVDGIAVVTQGDVTVQVPIGENFIYRNGEKIQNDTKAVVKNGRTYCPIRVVMESFGSEVIWDGHNKDVVIYTKDYEFGDSRYDLRNEGNITSVKDQGNLGTCWAFAALSAVESTLLLRTGESFDFSEDNISLGHGYNVTQNAGGDMMIALAYFTRWSGPIFERDDKYGDGKTAESAKSVKHLQEAYFVPPKNLTKLKEAIKAYGGIHTILYWDFDNDINYSPYYNNETHAYYYPGSDRVNHNVVIVGWDDNYPKENFKIQPQSDGAFICRNSFGTDFGEEGYFYVSYEDTYIAMKNIVYSGIEERDNYDKIYQSDWLGQVGFLGYSRDTAYFSNVYTVGEQAEELAAVSFYTTGMNSKYEIYVVNDFTSKEDFSKMTLVEKGFKEFKGYYTVSLKDKIKVEPGKKFAVVVKMTTPNSKMPVAIENDESILVDEFRLDDGEGYVSNDGKYWEDVEEAYKSNVCLKAFTNVVKDTSNPATEPAPDEKKPEEDKPAQPETEEPAVPTPQQNPPAKDPSTTIAFLEDPDRYSAEVRNRAKKLLGFF